jgi:hypothetical protein
VIEPDFIFLFASPARVVFLIRIAVQKWEMLRSPAAGAVCGLEILGKYGGSVGF